MHSHGAAAVADADPSGGRRLVLAGNPNTGKSAIFGRLTGLYADVSNFPGTTVEVSRGRLGPDALFDSPGVYGVSSLSEDERVARDLFLEADLVVSVVDGAHLERDLFLTLQLLDMGIPMVVALNMMDEVRARGREIDLPLLSELLGVPVFPTVATRNEGLAHLRAGLSAARAGPLPPELAERLAGLGDGDLARAEGVLLLEGDEAAAAALGLAPLAFRDELYAWRRERVDEITERVLIHSGQRLLGGNRLGYWLMRPLTGIPALLATLVVMYLVLGVVLAGNVVAFAEESIGQRVWEPWIVGLVGRVAPAGSVAGEMLTGQFGLLTMTVTYLFGVILPLVIGFYFLLSILEDSGYLPRIAVLADSLFQRVGLNGRAVIPMILGLGCVTMATISTRVLHSRRERMIATYLMALAVPCSAQLGVVLGILAALGSGRYVAVYAATILGVFLISGTLLARFVPGQSTDLMVDLAPMRVPRPGNVLRKTGAKAYMFMKEVALFFAAGALLLSTMQLTGALDWVQGALAPLTEQWLRLPPEAAKAFVMGFVRRDFGAAGLYEGDGIGLSMTPMQSLVALVAITLFVPCIASVLIILKERGRRYVATAWAGTLVTAFLAAGIVAQIARVIAA